MIYDLWQPEEIIPDGVVLGDAAAQVEDAKQLDDAEQHPKYRSTDEEKLPDKELPLKSFASKCELVGDFPWWLITD